jgi:hypothetical protein
MLPADADTADEYFPFHEKIIGFHARESNDCGAAPVSGNFKKKNGRPLGNRPFNPDLFN